MYETCRQADLPPECADFTAGMCNPNADEMLDSYYIPNTLPSAKSVCQVQGETVVQKINARGLLQHDTIPLYTQEVCQTIEGCNYFTYNSADEMCYLFQYR